jgi:hypothetical protein
MPTNTNALAALAALQDNKTNVLGVTMGKHVVEPGLYIPKSGTIFNASLSHLSQIYRN